MSLSSDAGGGEGHRPQVMHRLRTQVAGLAGGRIAGAGLSAAWFVVAARVLGISEFGDLSLLLAIGLIFQSMSDLGFPFLLAHTATTEPGKARAALRAVIPRRVVVAIVAALLTGLFYLLSASDASLEIPLVYAVSIIATAVYSSWTAVLRGLGDVRPEAANEVISRLILLVLGSGWLLAGGGLLAAVAVYSLVDLGSLIVLFGVAARAIPRTSTSIDASTFSLRRMFPLSTGRAFSAFYTRIDLWLLAVMVGGPAVGLYSAAYRLLDGISLFPRAVGAMAITHTAKLESLEQRRMGGRLIRHALLVVVPVAIVFMVGAGPILGIAFGDEYRQAAPALKILMASAVPGAIVLVLTPIVAVERSRFFASAVVATLLVNVLLNLWAIPAYEDVGAAWTTLVSQVLLAGALTGLFFRTTKRARTAPD